MTTTTKSKTTYRLVVDGAIRLGTKSFTCPALIPLSGSRVYVAYDAFSDAELDVIDFNQNIIATATAASYKDVA
ncbi:MAG: Mu transposase C-terminal domain-containing protein [Gammaproteobacteria bacterium]